MKLNINTTKAQPMNCDEIETFVRAHIGGVRTSLNEPEGGYQAMFPLTKNSQIPTIQATDGIYTDTKQKLQAKGINVTLATEAKECVRTKIIPWYNDADKSVFLAKYPTLDGETKVTKAEFDAMNSIPWFAGNNSVVRLDCLKMFPQITHLGNDNFRGGGSAFKGGCFKWIKTGYHNFYDGFGISRLVFPSMTNPGESFCWGNIVTLVDFGPNIRAIDNYFLSCNTNVNLVMRSNSVATLANQSYTVKLAYMFVPSSLVDSYKSATNWSTYADKIKAIGGPTWQSTFAENAASRGISASSPYADLTDEEQSWYDDLFPDLYTDWVAPTAD